MNATQTKITDLLDSSELELRIAAVRVIAEIGLNSKAAIQALGRCLREPQDELRLAALKALARLGAHDVAGMVVPLILSAGPLREQAMAVISAVGPSVIPQLKLLYPQADFHGKRAVITAISRVGGKEGLAFLLRILPSEPFELQKHLTLSISEALDRMSTGSQGPILALVFRLLRDRKTAKQPQLLVTGAILLGHARGHALAVKARTQLRLLAEKKLPPEVRRHAIVSWNRLQAEVKPLPNDYAFLFALLKDEDWHNVAQHALHGMERMPLEPRLLPKLIDLLHNSPHFSVHIHVFERLQTTDQPEVAEAILPFLADSRFRVREAAETALRKMPSAIDSLFFLLMRTDDLEVTQRINAVLRDFPQETRQKYVERALARLFKLFEANDPHYKSFLEFVKGVDPDSLRKRVYQMAHALKKSRRRDRWERIAAVVQLLWDNHLITPEGRYLLAVALIRLSPKDLSPAARRSNLGLRVLRSLIYDNYDELVKRLRGDKDLDPDDYHYLGFHFSEEGDDLRPFAMEMLQHTARQFPRSNAATAAMHKLDLIARAQAGSQASPEAGAGPQPRRAEAPKGKTEGAPAKAEVTTGKAEGATGKLGAAAGKIRAVKGRPEPQQVPGPIKGKGLPKAAKAPAVGKAPPGGHRRPVHAPSPSRLHRAAARGASRGATRRDKRKVARRERTRASGKSSRHSKGRSSRKRS